MKAVLSSGDLGGCLVKSALWYQFDLRKLNKVPFLTRCFHAIHLKPFSGSSDRAEASSWPLWVSIEGSLERSSFLSEAIAPCSRSFYVYFLILCGLLDSWGSSFLCRPTWFVCPSLGHSLQAGFEKPLNKRNGAPRWSRLGESSRLSFWWTTIFFLSLKHQELVQGTITGSDSTWEV